MPMVVRRRMGLHSKESRNPLRHDSEAARKCGSDIQPQETTLPTLRTIVEADVAS